MSASSQVTPTNAAALVGRADLPGLEKWPPLLLQRTLPVSCEHAQAVRLTRIFEKRRGSAVSGSPDLMTAAPASP
jgi:hypothetical protein